MSWRLKKIAKNLSWTLQPTKAPNPYVFADFALAMVVFEDEAGALSRACRVLCLRLMLTGEKYL